MPGKPKSQSRARKTISRRKSSSRKKTDIYKVYVIRFILAVLSLVLVFVVFKVYLAWQNRLWDGNSRITVVVATPDPTVYSYNPRSQTLITFPIPKETQLTSAMGYGEWMAGSLWALDDQEKKGGRLFASSVQKSLGMPIDGWMNRQGKGFFQNSSFSFLPSMIKALPNAKLGTNLTFFDRLNLAVAVGRVSTLNRREINLVSSGAIKESFLADGEKGFLVIPEKTVLVLDALRDDKVFEEAKTIKITNATGKSGVGAEVSRTVSILGIRVVAIDTGQENLKEVCVVRERGKTLKSRAAKQIIGLFGCTSDSKDPAGPASLEIILGEDFVKYF
ncbi:MAG: LytR C-terminal domain-containing protein [Candidatus Blackburnbacteria bacterium]|nr:LytR C-terminal domain-containing protein [Candidatus Blackburnbacteria bacterium]